MIKNKDKQDFKKSLKSAVCVSKGKIELLLPFKNVAGKEISTLEDSHRYYAKKHS